MQMNGYAAVKIAVVFDRRVIKQKIAGRDAQFQFFFGQKPFIESVFKGSNGRIKGGVAWRIESAVRQGKAEGFYEAVKEFGLCF